MTTTILVPSQSQQVRNISGLSFLQQRDEGQLPRRSQKGDDRGATAPASKVMEEMRVYLFFETTEGESEDLYDKLMVMTGWTPTVPKSWEREWLDLFFHGSNVVYMVVGCDENTCFDKVFECEIYFSKNWRPHCLYCDHLSWLGSTYVNICPYVRYFLHMSRYVHMLPLPNIWTNLATDTSYGFPPQRHQHGGPSTRLEGRPG
jgi:hypothetical protein